MENRHWSDDDFLARLYGIGPTNDHLDACEECRTRWEKLQLERIRMLSREIQVSQELLDRQRRSVFGRLEQSPRRVRLRLAASLAALLLTLVIVALVRPSLQREPMDVASEAKIFEEVFKISSSTEPSAIEPMQLLFEVKQ
jgi:predicted anti-sigma-YlaC factor YlaD